MNNGTFSRLNCYTCKYSNGTSLNVALFYLMANHFVSRITLQSLGIKIKPCRVTSLKDWRKSTFPGVEELSNGIL